MVIRNDSHISNCITDCFCAGRGLHKYKPQFIFGFKTTKQLQFRQTGYQPLTQCVPIEHPFLATALSTSSAELSITYAAYCQTPWYPIGKSTLFTWQSFTKQHTLLESIQKVHTSIKVHPGNVKQTKCGLNCSGRNRFLSDLLPKHIYCSKFICFVYI